MTQPGPPDDPAVDWAREEAGLIELSEIPPAPNYKVELVAERYLAQEVWDQETAVALAYGINPEEPWPVREPPRLTRWRRYVQTVVDMGRLKFPIQPRAFLDWAQSSTSTGLFCEETVQTLVGHLPSKALTREQIIVQIDELEHQLEGMGVNFASRIPRKDLLENLCKSLFVCMVLLAKFRGVNSKESVTDDLELDFKLICRGVTAKSLQRYLKRAEDLLNVRFSDALERVSDRTSNSGAG